MLRGCSAPCPGARGQASPRWEWCWANPEFPSTLHLLVHAALGCTIPKSVASNPKPESELKLPFCFIPPFPIHRMGTKKGKKMKRALPKRASSQARGLAHPFCTAARGSLLLRTHTMITAKRKKKEAAAKPMRYTALWPRKPLQSAWTWTPSTEPLPSQKPGSCRGEEMRSECPGCSPSTPHPQPASKRVAQLGTLVG